MDSLLAPGKIAASGMHAQSERLLIISQNIANANSTGSTPGADPYSRKTISFASEVDRASGATMVSVAGYGVDHSPFRVDLDPGNPAADKDGFVKLPNVNMLMEMADMRQANRVYQANLQVYKQARELVTMTLDLMRS